ncbi:MAG: A/G-specific adenine glycosylase [Rhodobacteraceae bacterium]|nr:A/G-specific adenine glycosylase [Paracoccaceae bacterium]MCY4196248.1 A/G-specific adenine glycosylase [Paracoccaceae bacterium]MCY4326005.1 A/G-specific adenine glycosylase [Paracoccaceae bacterium]
MTDSMPDTGLSDSAADIAQKLLDWYDQYGRELPWRLHPRSRAPSQRPDPYQVWLSEVMLQQTTVVVVAGRFETFVRLWPTVHDLAAAADESVMAAWAGLGYYARARNLLKCARRIVDDHDGVFPQCPAELETLPGIGPYTAAAIASIAFNQPSAAADGNIERVLARLFAIETPLPKAKTQLRQLAGDLCPQQRSGDWLQGLMDLGSLICRPRNPKCDDCPLAQNCIARQESIQETLPRRSPQHRRRTARGILYVGRRQDGAWLLEYRPPGGLYGGMLGWPGWGWAENAQQHQPPCQGNWQRVGDISHMLTHMDLHLEIHTAHLPIDAVPKAGQFIPSGQFRVDALPSLMRKAHALVIARQSG